jgi:Domain of unknown function (DUF4160)
MSSPCWTKDVRTLLIFLNELSFATQDVHGMLGPVLSALDTVKAAKRIRGDLVVAGSVPISDVPLGDGTRTLAGLLRGDDYRDEWRFLQSLNQLSPWGAFPGSMSPGVFQEVHYDGRTATGMLWAKQNHSWVLSFAFPPDWGANHIDAQFREMDANADITSTAVQIPNLSRPEHVSVHENSIRNYGRTLSASSMVYQGTGFVIRMYFNDHDPAHFHVLEANSSETLARLTIETLDVMSGKLPAAVRTRVIEWARQRRGDLMQCWHRCRNGQHPLSLED